MSDSDWNERIPISRRAAMVLVVHAVSYVRTMRRLIEAGESVSPEFVTQLDEVERAASIVEGQTVNGPVPRPGDRRSNKAYAPYRQHKP